MTSPLQSRIYAADDAIRLAAVQYFLWSAVYSSSPPGTEAIGGFTFPQIITYFAVGWVVRVSCFNNIDREIADRVSQGDIVLDLLRPASLLVMRYGAAVGETTFRLLFMGLPTAVVLFPLCGVEPPAFGGGPAESALAILEFAVSVVLAFHLFFLLNFLIGVSAVFLEKIQGFLWAKFILLDKYVIRGEFDRVLLRPLNPLFQILLENFSLEFIPDLALGAVILGSAAGALGLGWTFGGALLLVLMLLGAVLVLLGMFLALASVSFWAEDRVGVLPPVYNLMAFGRYPLTIYRPAVQALLSWVLPFGFMAFYPASGFLGKKEFAPYFWGTPVAGVVIFILGYQVFRAGVRRYQSTGS